MTARELYTHVLTEINKLGAPSMLLEDFIYLVNKAVQQYTNKAYNEFETTQQSIDNLRVLKTSAELEIQNDENASSPLEYGKYYCVLPADYLHLLNCVVAFERVNDDDTGSKCSYKDEEGGMVYSPARRLTADQYPNIITNYYFKPTYKRPYYYINNVNDNDNDPVFPEPNQELKPTNSKMDSLIMSLEGKDRIIGGRHSNSSPAIMEIRCGKNPSHLPTKVYIDYIKSPMRIVLSRAELDGVDHSQVLEFPDYVCYEIINEMTKLVLENISDPRLQTNPVVNATIGQPQNTKTK